MTLISFLATRREFEIQREQITQDCEQSDTIEYETCEPAAKNDMLKLYRAAR